MQSVDNANALVESLDIIDICMLSGRCMEYQKDAFDSGTYCLCSLDVSKVGIGDILRLYEHVELRALA